MIENVETYNCEQSNCGRKFPDFELLLDHYKRRHPTVYKIYEKRKNFFDELTNQIDSFEREAKEAIFLDREREEVIENSMIDMKEINEIDNFNVSLENLKETKSTCITEASTNNPKPKEKRIATISEDMIGIGVIYTDYNDVEEVRNFIFNKIR